jgi:hypothetical protein
VPAQIAVEVIAEVGAERRSCGLILGQLLAGRRRKPGEIIQPADARRFGDAGFDQPAAVERIAANTSSINLLRGAN